MIAQGERINKDGEIASEYLSRPIETLLAENGNNHNSKLICDVLIIGSGYGGSISALEISRQKQASVWVLERGNEYKPGDFPEDIGDLPGHVQYSRPNDAQAIGKVDALFDLKFYKDVSVLTANCLGGGSQINAAVVYEPPKGFFDDGSWPHQINDNTLRPYLSEVKKLLEAKPFPIENSKKYAALKKLSEALPNTICEPAVVAIRCDDGNNAWNIPQSKCIECGNCVTGCNHNAKNTLTVNAIPLARNYGAKFYIGATAISLERYTEKKGECAPSTAALAPRWKINCLRTATAKQSQADNFEIYAHTVIVAAGTLGSTEILLRSQRDSRLACSEQLGKHFSGNGDFLAAGYAQKNRVDAVANADMRNSAEAIGPTILGVIRPDSDSGRLSGVVYEDGAVPAALSTVIGTLMSTLSVPQRYVKSGLPAWFEKNRDADPLGVNPAALRHTQILLGMGHDDAAGTMTLAKNRLTIAWPRAAEQAVHLAMHKTMQRAENKGGFDGGDYLPNPAWQPLPEEFSEITGGSSRLGVVTVHPLGGCCMGNTRLDGVVDHWGNVFDASDENTSGTHAGLYVLDGAIIPHALGFNPLMTISALAMRAAEHIVCGLDKKISSDLLPRLMRIANDSSATATARRPTDKIRSEIVKLCIQEYLIARKGLDILKPCQALLPADVAEKIGTERGLAIEVDIKMPNVWGWLENPALPLSARAVLYWQEQKNFETTVPKNLHFIAEGSAQVTLLKRDSAKNIFVQLYRLWTVFRAVKARRKNLILKMLSDDLRAYFIDKDKDKSLLDIISKALKAFKSFWRFLVNHTHWRIAEYEIRFDLPSSPDKNNKSTPLIFVGKKTLAYTLEDKNPWSALMEIDLEMRAAAHNDSHAESFVVDIVGLLKRRRCQVCESPNTPTSITALTAVGAMFVRSLFTTHLWTFRGLDYDKIKPVPPIMPRPIRLKNKITIKPETYSLSVKAHAGKPETIDILLTSYRNHRDFSGKPLLFIHSHAMSGEQYTTNTVDCNMAGYFADKGYDVWILDYRLSPRLGNIPRRAWTMDDIAENDIPAAVDFIYSHYSNSPINIFAHCIGAGCTAMAVLKGNLHDTSRKKSKVARLITHAVHPWVVPSHHNRISGALGAFFRDVVGDPVVDVHPPAASTSFDEIFDRIAASYPWDDIEQELHLQDFAIDSSITSVCDRAAIVYGRMFFHPNIQKKTHAEFGGMIGPSNFEIFRQFFFMLLRYRLTSRNGDNIYLTSTNIQQYWTFDTMFAHGMENGLFNPASAVRSATILEQIQQQHRVELFISKNTGHLDFLFGKNAASPLPTDANSQTMQDPQYFGCGIYDELFRFFENPETPRPDYFEDLADEAKCLLRMPNEAPRTACVGPSFNYEQRDDHPVVFHVWAEQSLSVSSPFASPAAYASFTNANPVNGFVRDMTCDWNHEFSQHNLSMPGQFWSAAIPLSGNQLALEPKSLCLDLYYRNIKTGFPSKLGLFILPLHNKNVVIRPAIAKVNRPSLTAIPTNFPSCEVQLAGSPWFDKLRNDPQGNDRKWTLLAGSCRWPGITFETIEIDRLFHAMQQQATNVEIGVDALCLLGDQIYADATANIFKTREKKEAFASAYRNAFSGDSIGDEMFPAVNFAKLLCSLPSWMIVDDHEYSDNWAGSNMTFADEDFVNGFIAAISYQWRQPPSMNSNDIPSPFWPVRGLWKEFQIRGLPVFAMDTRSERELRTAANWRDANLISQSQQTALENWLIKNKGSGKPLLILCGSPIGIISDEEYQAPDIRLNTDNWLGYPKTLVSIFSYIAQHEISNVIFVSGDPHFSAMSTVEIKLHENAKPIYAASVILSGFNATLSFANARFCDYKWDSAFKIENCVTPPSPLSVKFRPQKLSEAFRQFGRIDLDFSNGNRAVCTRIFDSDKLLDFKRIDLSLPEGA